MMTKSTTRTSLTCAALILAAGLLMGAGSARADHESRRLADVYYLDLGGKTLTLELHADKTFLLTVPRQGRIAGVFNATDDEIAFRADGDYRHFRYDIRGGDLVLTPTYKDRYTRRDCSLLDALPPFVRGEVAILRDAPACATIVTAPHRPHPVFEANPGRGNAWGHDRDDRWNDDRRDDRHDDRRDDRRDDHHDNDGRNGRR